MTRICHITTVHDNRHDIRIFEKECVSLQRAGYEVCLIVNDDKADEIKDGVRIFSLRQRPKSRMDRAVRISKLALQKALELDAKCYHIHDPELLRIVPQLKRHGKRVIFDSHEFTAKQIENKKYIPRLLRKPTALFYLGYEKRILEKCDALITPCTYEGRDYFSGVETTKEIISNYPSTQVLEAVLREGEEPGSCSIPDDQLKEALCYVGAISESRGIFQMIRAAHAAGRKLIVIGTIAENIKEALTSMPECECVEYLGPLPHPQAMKIISKCAVGLSLLLDRGQYMKIDTLSTKAYEYMYLGLPTVLSGSPYSEKVLSTYKCGIAVDPSDVSQIADAVKEIMSDPELYKSMSDEGKRAVRERFNWENEAGKLTGLYKSIGV